MLILASASPRRQELLRVITADFTVRAADVDETVGVGAKPAEAVRDLALRKAEAVFRQCPGEVVIGADTVVALGDQIMGKPCGGEEAFRMLRALSGAEHRVYTGVAVLSKGRRDCFAEETAVEFHPLEEEEIRRYIGTGEPFDKAGAYGIQGKGALFVRAIRGDYYNVMGLPVSRLSRLLRERYGIGGWKDSPVENRMEL